jgi:quinol monooxygenase YgiN
MRHVALVRFKEGTPEERVEAIERAMKAISFEGCRRWDMVRDLRLREGNAPYAFIADFADLAAFQAYDAHPEHQRVRRELIVPILDRIERIQYEVP